MRDSEDVIDHLEEALHRADELLLEWMRFNELMRLELEQHASERLEHALDRADQLLVEWSRFGDALRVQLELDRRARLGIEVFDA